VTGGGAGIAQCLAELGYGTPVALVAEKLAAPATGDHRPAAHAFYARLGYRTDERRFVKRAPAADG
jgi:hypothetical protein